MGYRSLAMAAALCFSAAVHGQALEGSWDLIGKTFPRGSEMGFPHYVGGVMFDRDYRPWLWDEELEEYPDIMDKRICITMLSTDTENPREAANFHIFLIRIDRETDTFEVFDELDIDRGSDDEYLHEEVGYEYDGKYHSHFALIRVDPRDDSIKQWYQIDIENMRFVATDPYPGMKVLWQEP